MKIPKMSFVLSRPTGATIVLAAALAAAIFPAKMARAQSKLSADQKDQEIELLKTEVKQLEQRVENLEGLDQR